MDKNLEELLIKTHGLVENMDGRLTEFMDTMKKDKTEQWAHINGLHKEMSDHQIKHPSPLKLNLSTGGISAVVAAFLTWLFS